MRGRSSTELLPVPDGPDRPAILVRVLGTAI